MLGIEPCPRQIPIGHGEVVSLDEGDDHQGEQSLHGGDVVGLCVQLDRPFEVGLPLEGGGRGTERRSSPVGRPRVELRSQELPDPRVEAHTSPARRPGGREAGGSQLQEPAFGITGSECPCPLDVDLVEQARRDEQGPSVVSQSWTELSVEIRTERVSGRWAGARRPPRLEDEPCDPAARRVECIGDGRCRGVFAEDVLGLVRRRPEEVVPDGRFGIERVDAETAERERHPPDEHHAEARRATTDKRREHRHRLIGVPHDVGVVEHEDDRPATDKAADERRELGRRGAAAACPRHLGTEARTPRLERADEGIEQPAGRAMP